MIYNTSIGQITQNIKSSGHGIGLLIKDMDNPIGVEIGCASGITTEWLLRINPTLKLTSIDPYVDYSDWNGMYLNNLENLYRKTIEKFSNYRDRFNLIRDFSDNTVNLIPDNSLDFIFIDGLHTYEQVLKDCNNYYSKVKTGGIFSGHDYTVIRGVNQAVNEFAAKVNKQILTTECDVWYWYK